MHTIANKSLTQHIMEQRLDAFLFKSVATMRGFFVSSVYLLRAGAITIISRLVSIYSQFKIVKFLKFNVAV